MGGAALTAVDLAPFCSAWQLEEWVPDHARSMCAHLEASGGHRGRGTRPEFALKWRAAAAVEGEGCSGCAALLTGKKEERVGLPQEEPSSSSPLPAGVASALRHIQMHAANESHALQVIRQTAALAAAGPTCHCTALAFSP